MYFVEQKTSAVETETPTLNNNEQFLPLQFRLFQTARFTENQAGNGRLMAE